MLSIVDSNLRDKAPGCQNSQVGKAIISPDIQYLQLVAAANQASQPWILETFKRFNP